jgi:hypothetical protein
LLAYFASKKVKIMIPLGAAACMRESPGKRKRSRRDQVGRGEERCPPKCTRPQLNFHLILLLAAGLGFYMCTLRVFEYNSHMRCLSRKKNLIRPGRINQRTHAYIKDRARISSKARKKLLLHWFRVDDEE